MPNDISPEEKGANNPTDPNVVKPQGGDTPPKSEDGKTDPPTMVPVERLNEEINKTKQVRTELEKIKADQEAAEKKRLEEDQKYKELYEKSEAEKQALAQTTRETAVRAAFIEAASGKIASELVGDAYTLAHDQLKDVQVTDGLVTGIEDIVSQLVQHKPYLAGKGSAAVGNPTNPAPTGGTQPPGKRIYTQEEINNMPMDEFRKNQDDILRAQTDGRIQ